MSVERKKIFLHVGLPKTGTSSFQANLAHNMPALEADGLLIANVARFPELRSFSKAAGRVCKYGSWDFVARRDMGIAAKEFCTKISVRSHERILISHENLLGWRIDNLYNLSFANGALYAVKSLERALAQHELTWILGTRLPKDHIRSAYHYVTEKKGKPEDYEAWMRRVGSVENLSKLVADAAQYWGEDSYIFSMEDQIGREGIWGRNILEKIGVSAHVLDSLDDVGPQNTRLPRELMPYLDRLNKINLDKKQRREVYRLLADLHTDLGAKVWK